MNEVSKRVTNGYSLRFSESDRDELQKIANAKSASIGKKVPLAQILKEAVAYGLPFVKQEILHQSVMPMHSKTNTQRIVGFAKSVLAAAAEHGIESLPGEAA